MVAINGTYDVMLVPLLMPVSQILNLLPPNIRGIEPSPLIPFTQDQITLLGLDASAYDAQVNHPVMLELGYQNHTGPGPRFFRPSFDEAKLEVLGMRHPSLSGKQPNTADKGFVYKQLILFSNLLLYTSSNLIAGLRSNLVTITPAKSPSIYPVDQATILYNVKDYIEVNFSKNGQQQSAANNGAIQWAGRPWYGWATGDTLTQFVFDTNNAKIPPVPYKADTRVKTPAFYDPSAWAQAAQVNPEWAEFDGVASWRFQADYYSRDIKAADANSGST
ncbi:uncharacterized protein UMAG_01894 [Mycosarcoma maydis]|uniref:Uncharacterized protein n=1 Tax=Mycosarcoma maydis TaxID=5270 RepID=A0A0D1E3Q3_MYCMD|nr:uncharacterized protein UMAG_01894 [Ustilago maydis 521]KIS70739.1 hypothetical protein UMAG_01894 [Ustilago maydis 521]|eukprot:XP_011387827.1 hypothetical protein UMAG_01894 [Ustilago maydis 521]